MASVISDLTDGIRRLQKLNKDMSELELREEILNLRQLLMDAREELVASQEREKELEAKIKAMNSGDKCPLCDEGTLKIVASRSDPTWGVFGVQERTLRCEKCGHTEKRQHDPDNMRKKNA